MKSATTEGTPDSGRKEALAALRDLLEDGDEADRCHACRVLGRLRARDAVPALVQRLADEDVDVCVDAAIALGAIGDPAAGPALCASLRNDPDGDVRIAAVQALGRIGGPDALPALLEIAASRPDDTVFDPESDWDPWWDMQKEAVEALGRFGVTEATPLLERLLDDEEGQDIEVEILAALARVGIEGERVLVGRIRAASPQARRRAVRALSRGTTPQSLEALGRAVRDPARTVRVAGLEAIAERSATTYLPATLALCRDEDEHVRAAAIRAATQLASLTGNDALPIDSVLALLDDRDATVRELALRALEGRARELDRGALDRIGHLARAPEPNVAAAACTVLAAAEGSDSAARLVGILDDLDAPDVVRATAATGLGRSGTWDPTTGPALSRALADGSPPVRLAGLEALMSLVRAGVGLEAEDGRSPLELVVSALRGEIAPSIAACDEEGLGAVAAVHDSIDTMAGTQEGSPEATAPAPTLPSAGEDGARPARSSLEAIAIDNAEVALALAESERAEEDIADVSTEDLGEYAAIVEANEATAQWLFSRDALPLARDVQRLAARVLGELPVEPVVRALAEALAGDNGFLHRDAAGSIARIAECAPAACALEPVAGPLLKRVASDDRDVRIACLRAIGHAGIETGRAAVLRALEDRESAVRREAAHALAGLMHRGVGAAAPPCTAREDTSGGLLGLLRDPEPVVRVAAARALAKTVKSGAAAHDRATALAAIVEAAFHGAGGQAREMGRALRAIDPGAATTRLLGRLDSLASGAERRFVIEMLEEIHVARDTGDAT